MNKSKPQYHKERTSASASATSLASASKLMLSTSVTSEILAAKSKSKRSTTERHTDEKEEHVVIFNKEQEGSTAESQEPAAEVPETVAVPGRKRKGKSEPFKASNWQGHVNAILTNFYISVHATFSNLRYRKSSIGSMISTCTSAR